jgi:pSer/pThr/pTyr-binding forkhead associated (FHA) protein
MDGTPLLFPPGQYLFGRAQGCHVLFAPSSIVSRRHCLLLVTGETISVRDLKSRNGTLVNKNRIKGEKQLKHGDLLAVGETIFQVEINLPDTAGAALGIEVSGKPLGETIDMPLGGTAVDRRLEVTKGPRATRISPSESPRPLPANQKSANQ